MSVPDNCNPIEILPGKLVFFAADDSFKPSASSQTHVFFKTDTTLVYTAFFADFGPLDLGLTCTFCQQLHDLLTDAQTSNKIVAYYCSKNGHCRANSAVLLCGYMIFVLGYTAERAYGHFIGIEPPLSCFRDAAFCINTFPITALDCARAMRRAVTFNHFNYLTFSVEQFQRMNKLQHGDCSWIIPGKFIAFSGPIAKRRQLSAGVHTLTPIEYVPVLKALGVTCIVRFNSKCYDRSVFTSNGIRHVELFYEDGGNPSEAILQSFLQVCENEKGAIAVHCKAGLGRTGTNIAAYMMKHYGYSAREATAWCRLCRPGCVVGPQQHYLCSIEERIRKEGDEYRKKNNIRTQFPPQFVPANGHLQYTSQAPQLPAQVSVMADGRKLGASTENLKDFDDTALPVSVSLTPPKGGGAGRPASPSGVADMMTPTREVDVDRSASNYAIDRKNTATPPLHKNGNGKLSREGSFRSIFARENLSNNNGEVDSSPVDLNARPSTSAGISGERRMRGNNSLHSPAPQRPVTRGSSSSALREQGSSSGQTRKGVEETIVTRKMAFVDSSESGGEGLNGRAASSSRTGTRRVSSYNDVGGQRMSQSQANGGRPKTANVSAGSYGPGAGLSSSAPNVLRNVASNSRYSASERSNAVDVGADTTSFGSRKGSPYVTRPSTSSAQRARQSDIATNANIGVGGSYRVSAQGESGKHGTSQSFAKRAVAATTSQSRGVVSSSSGSRRPTSSSAALRRQYGYS